VIPGSSAVGTITVRYFAGAAEAAACEEERLEIGGFGPATSGPRDPRSAEPRSAEPRLAEPGAPTAGSTTPEPAPTVADLRATLVAAHGAAFARVLGRCSVLVSGVRASDADPVPPGAVVDVLPPFAGG